VQWVREHVQVKRDAAELQDARLQARAAEADVPEMWQVLSVAMPCVSRRADDAQGDLPHRGGGRREATVAHGCRCHTRGSRAGVAAEHALEGPIVQLLLCRLGALCLMGCKFLRRQINAAGLRAASSKSTRISLYYN
jgi:hypothetical protein